MTSAAVASLFFLSGACALGYEVIWAKTLALALGGSAAAQAAVLAAFLGGLAGGAALFGPAADRAERPLRLFALLELGVAACGYLAPWVLSSPAGVGLVAAAAALMGGTFPALARAAHRGTGLERTLAWLYAANNAGAAAGALAAGFVLIPRLGLTGASHALAGLGAAVAAAAWLLSGTERAAAPASAFDDAPDPVPTWLVVCAVLVSGVVTLCYEAAWVRLLAVVLGASTYSFTAMLAGFVGGMGLGSFVVASGLLARRPPARLFGLAQLGAGMAVLASWPLYERLPWLFWRLSSVVPKTAEGYVWFEAAKLSFCFLLTLAPTAFLGAAFPLAGRTAAARLGRVGAGVGAVAAAAALGNVIGAMVAGLELLPALGVQGLLTAGAATNLALGAAVVWADGSWPRGRRALAAGLAAAALGWHVLWGGSWDRLLLAMGTHRLEGVEDLPFRGYLEALRFKRRVLFQKDDAEASVSVMEIPEDGIRALMINGKADASNGIDMGTQILLGQLGFVLRPGARDALLVGLGSGVTAGTALRWPIERLDVVELSPAVAEASLLFTEWSGGPLRDPRLELHLADGRAFLRGTQRRWDVIVSEPSNPWIAGIGNLFTLEYFRLARSRLRPGGVMVQWFHLYETEDAPVASVLRTFSEAFDDVSVWRTNGGDAFIVGFNGRPEPDFAAMAAALTGPPADVLEAGGLGGLTALLSLQTLGDAGTREAASAGRLNSDRRPFLEYAAPRGRFLGSFARALSEAEDDLGQRRGELLWRRLVAGQGFPPSDREYQTMLQYQQGRREGWALSLAEEWTRSHPRSDAAKLWLARARLASGRHAEAVAALWGLKTRGPEALRLSAEAKRALGDAQGARRDAAAAARLVSGGTAAELWLKAALWAMDDGEGGEAADSLGAALTADPTHEQARSLYEHLLKSYGKEPAKRG